MYKFYVWTDEIEWVGTAKDVEEAVYEAIEDIDLSDPPETPICVSEIGFDTPQWIFR